MARPHEKRSALKVGASLCTLATVLAACARYEATPHSLAGAGDAGMASGGVASGGMASGGMASGGMASGGAGVAAGSGGAPAGSGGKQAIGGAGASSGAPGTGGTMSGGAAGTGGTSVSAGGGGGQNNAGTGGVAGASGTVGSAGSAGSGGGVVGVEQLLSQGKPASADSEETLKGNLAALGNDGVATTRWCAADGLGGHYWQVDLGQSHTLTKLQITWEKAAVYQFKVEGSPDATAWALLLDQTQSTNASAAQSYPLPAASTARWIRVTTTTLPNASTWASFFELGVFGY